IRTGDADRDGDGAVSLGELYGYVYDRVRERSPQQTPGKWEFGVHGDLLVARNPHRRITPGRVPPELPDLGRHSSPIARPAAVGELAHLAAGSNLALAAAARLALATLADDDSRRVSAAAEHALDGVTVRLARSAIDLGRVRAGTAPLVTEVALEGGPLALASAVSVSVSGTADAASAGSLRARLAAGILRVTWTPGRTGSLDAVVALTGPAGDATLRVTGEVVAEPTKPPRQADPAPPTPGTAAAGSGRTRRTAGGASPRPRRHADRTRGQPRPG